MRSRRRRRRRGLEEVHEWVEAGVSMRSNSSRCEARRGARGVG